MLRPQKILNSSFLLLFICSLATCKDAKGSKGTEKVPTPSPTKPAETKSTVPTKSGRSTQASNEKLHPTAERQKEPESLPNGLLLTYAQFEVGADGKSTAKPGPARLEILSRTNGKWQTEVIRDPDSNVFHKAIFYRPQKGASGILTFGGSAAAVKLWKRTKEGFQAETLWQEDFGGRFSRMRDAEVADVLGQGNLDIVVGTHDQGIIALLRPNRSGKTEIIRLGQKKDTFIHEIEIGDLDSDNTLEVYATPSEPNRLDGRKQHGTVIRYIPKKKLGPETVADLGNRHAKEILVADVDGDQQDELYVAVEALTEGKGASIRIIEPVEIRRYDMHTPKDKGRVIARLNDRFCRFLSVGDIEGDGQKEMIASAFRSGIWLIRHPRKKQGKWEIKNIDRDSSGFEHASLLTDLDGDGRDELYVAADDQGELRRYTWNKGKMNKETIHRRNIPGLMMTWNITPINLTLFPKK